MIRLQNGEFRHLDRFALVMLSTKISVSRTILSGTQRSVLSLMTKDRRAPWVSASFRVLCSSHKHLKARSAALSSGVAPEFVPNAFGFLACSSIVRTSILGLSFFQFSLAQSGCKLDKAQQSLKSSSWYELKLKDQMGFLWSICHLP